jgi:hypothetical protein
MLLLNTLPLVINPSLYRKLPFDVTKDVAPSSPEQLGAHIKRELARWPKVVKDNHIEPQ